MPERSLVGILGGMGPAATAAFYTRLVESTPATRDQDHLRIVMWADPTVPDRTAALLEDGESIVPWLERGVRALRASGADIIVCPCNTAHVWLGAVAREHGVELLSIVNATIEEATTAGRHDGPIGILATEATLSSGLYQEALTQRGLAPLVPEPQDQARLIEAIYRVKAGTTSDFERATALIAQVCGQLAASGAGTIICACTELSLVLQDVDPAVRIIDSTDALVRAVVATQPQPEAPGTRGLMS